MYQRTSGFTPYMQKYLIPIIGCLTIALASLSWSANQDTENVPEVSQQVIGGVNAAIHRNPWMAALVFDDPTDFTRQFCGGTAIDRYWVLTAAHCVDESRNLKDFQFVFGTSDLENNNTAYVAYPSLIVLHPDYINLFNRENDIALVQLREPLPESVEILPLGGSPELETPGLNVRVLGWGRTTSDPIFPEDTNLLQEGEVNLVSNDFANQEAYYDGRVTDSMIVAGKLDPYVSTFRGDSGGPSVIRRFLVGEIVRHQIALTFLEEVGV